MQSRGDAATPTTNILRLDDTQVKHELLPRIAMYCHDISEVSRG